MLGPELGEWGGDPGPPGAHRLVVLQLYSSQVLNRVRAGAVSEDNAVASLTRGRGIGEDFSGKAIFRLRPEAGVEVSWGRPGEEECSMLWGQQWKRRRGRALCLARPEGPVADSWSGILMAGSEGEDA